MQDDVVYLSTEPMIAKFYTPNRKTFINNQPVYSAVLQLEIPYDKNKFRPDEDYMNDILSLTDYKMYDKYISLEEYPEYIDQYISFFKLGISKKEDIDFRYLLLKNRKLGMQILADTDPKDSINLGCVAHIDKIPITCIKSVCISDIFETTISELTEKAINNAIKKVDFCIERPVMDMDGVLL